MKNREPKRNRKYRRTWSKVTGRKVTFSPLGTYVNVQVGNLRLSGDNVTCIDSNQ